jgi:hypothetical protein
MSSDANVEMDPSSKSPAQMRMGVDRRQTQVKGSTLNLSSFDLMNKRIRKWLDITEKVKEERLG